MRESNIGYIIFDKIDKVFIQRNGDEVHNMISADMFTYEEDVILTIKDFKQEDRLEVWEIIKTAETIP